jgi:hypothetical protein
MEMYKYSGEKLRAEIKKKQIPEAKYGYFFFQDNKSNISINFTNKN